MRRILLAITLIITSIVFVACGGGGGGGGSSPGPITTIGGTAATGAPIATGTITITDIHGVTTTGTVGVSGSFSIDPSGLTAPLLIKLEGVTAIGSPITLYSTVASFSTGSINTSNITPLTDAIVRLIAGTGNSVSPASVLPLVTQSTINQANNVLTGVLSNALSQAGVSSNSDFITTSFAPNGTGIDFLLDGTKVVQNIQLSSLEIQNAFTSGSASISALQAGLSQGPTITGSLQAVVNLSSTQLAQITQVTNAFDLDFSNGDLQSILSISSPNFLQDGMNAHDFWSNLLQTTGWGTAVINTVANIESCSSNLTCNVSFRFTSTTHEPFSMYSYSGMPYYFFTQIVWDATTNKWLLYGRQNQVQSTVTYLINQTNQYLQSSIAYGTPTASYLIDINRTGSVAGITSVDVFVNNINIGTLNGSSFSSNLSISDTTVASLLNVSQVGANTVVLKIYKGATLFETQTHYGVGLPLTSGYVSNTPIMTLTSDSLNALRSYNGATSHLNLFLTPNGTTTFGFRSYNYLGTTGIPFVPSSGYTQINVDFIMSQLSSIPSSQAQASRSYGIWGFDPNGRFEYVQYNGCNFSVCQ